MTEKCSWICFGLATVSAGIFAFLLIEEKKKLKRIRVSKVRDDDDLEIPSLLAQSTGQNTPVLLRPDDSLVSVRPDRLGERYIVVSPLFAHTEFSGRFIDDSATLLEAVWRNESKGREFKVFSRCGPRERLHFEPWKVKAAIVTSGGLCPGLNNVIRGITQMLSLYGVKKIYGVKFGFLGITDDSAWIDLNMEIVETIHQLGGSLLVANRGHAPPKDMAAALVKRGINMLYVIGGDGSHRGMAAIERELELQSHECTVVGIPKTIDNDIPVIDVSFGFGTAVAEAVRAVQAAYVEASGAPNGIGLVKLMGRSSGFVVLYAVIAAALVDVALLPEMEDISMPLLLGHIKRKMKEKGKCVIVVAEGCGKTLMDVDVTKRDGGGNLKLPDVGIFLKEQLNIYSKKESLGWAVKYIDPTYMIRAVPANAYDSVYCHVLAHNAVHSAMAGYTGFSCGRVDQHFVMIPSRLIADRPPRQVNVGGRWFSRMLMFTGQPSFSPPGKTIRKSSFII